MMTSFPLPTALGQIKQYIDTQMSGLSCDTRRKRNEYRALRSSEGTKLGGLLESRAHPYDRGIHPRLCPLWLALR